MTQKSNNGEDLIYIDIILKNLWMKPRKSNNEK